jgi:predicted PhzF superfamily epimerase YddE/YHI9
MFYILFKDMKIPIFQVDAFASELFRGNPAAVMLLDSFLPDKTLQAIAAENNLAETAYIVEQAENYQLRWFTPEVEVPLCGHATLASAAVVLERLKPGRKEVVFHTLSGALYVERSKAGYLMNFPARPSQPVSVPKGLAEALGALPLECVENNFNYLVRLPSAGEVRDVHPKMDGIAALDRPGLIVTAEGDGEYDFVSRYFAPQKGIPEDPVTGSAHCMLAPYWAQYLNKNNFRGFQASRRGGEVLCRILGDRVELGGSCIFFLQGQVEI